MKLHLAWKRSFGLVEASVGYEVFNFDFETLITKVRYSITGPERLLGLQEFENTKISRQSANEDESVVNSTHQEVPWYSFLLQA
jgi:hypothetical protein